MKKLIFDIATKRSRKFFSEKYSLAWYKEFTERSRKHYREITPKIPDIGKGIFSFNYKFAPAYISWYRAFTEMNVPADEIDKNIWRMNELIMGAVPKPMLHSVGKTYLNGFRRKASAHIKKQNTTGVHPYDWLIEYRDIDSNCFEIDITRCGFKTLAKDYGAEGMLPGICRVDYLSAYLMGNGFERTKTLGDGDDCCSCRYFISGSCEWSPEKGFTDRK